MEKTAEEILIKHLDNNGVVISRLYVGYLYQAMKEYAELKNKELKEELGRAKKEYRQLGLNK